MHSLVSMRPGTSFGAATGIPSPRTTVPFRAGSGTSTFQPLVKAALGQDRVALAARGTGWLATVSHGYARR